MKLTVPTNWQTDLIKRIKKPGVDTIYGKLDRDFIGGGRASCVLPKVTERKAKLHIDETHKEGLRFYYLLNASCLGNREWTIAGHKELNRLLDWLSKIKVDGVVVASPYLLQYIKKKYSHFKVSVSCFAEVNSVEKTKFWEDYGASVITLSQMELNRNFRLLQEIRRNVSCELQLIVNDNCIQDCPIFFYHNNASSHASQIASKLGNFMFDYCRLNCRNRRINNPVNFIRGSWIRPEDIKIYEDIGINRFKLTDRTMHSDAIALIVDAYSKRSYKGNLCDLFTSSSKSLWLKKRSIYHKFKYFFHPFTVNIFKLIKKRSLVNDVEVYIDNAELEGFLNYFFDVDCRYESCSDCGYCREITEKAVKIDHECRQRLINQYSSFMDELISGEMFRY